MANREKKLSLSKRQTYSPVSPPKDLSPELSPSSTDNDGKISASAIAKKLSKTAAKKAIKKLQIQMKTKAPPKLNKRVVAKGLIGGNKQKRAAALVRNGVKLKSRVKQEPMEVPVGEGSRVVAKKQVRKRAGKKADVVVSSISSIDETIESIVRQSVMPEVKVVKKARVVRKKPVLQKSNESMEEIMNDLTCLIANPSKIKKEPMEVTPQKTKKYTKKQIELLKTIKQEYTENKEGLNDSKVIDLLDLNVQKVKTKPVSNRRHSIEKFPVNSLENCNAPTIAQLKLFSNLPKAKRSSLRQSIDGFVRRTNPYATRSDSPARILRNGKHRKLKDLNLLDGLEIRKRRRIGSDYSGSELSVSKSGYDSDSSYSDMASLRGDETGEQKELEVKMELVKQEEGTTDEVTGDINFGVVPGLIIKRSESMDAESVKERRDSNSNLFNDVKKVEPECFENLSPSSSLKVPEKSIILNIMKQTFNDVPNEELEKDKHPKNDCAMSPMQFYGSNSKELPVMQPEEISVELEAAEQEKTVIDQLELADDNNKQSNGDVQENEEVANEIVPKEDKTDQQTIDNSCSTSPAIEETPENLAIKENILQALGLQSLKAAEEAKKDKKVVVKPENIYTGTLKTVIKLNRCEKKKGRNSLKMTLQKRGSKSSDAEVKSEEEGRYKIMKDKEISNWKTHGNHSSDTAGAHRKSHYSNRSNMDGSSEHTSDGDGETHPDGSAKTLVIPEKASSFSIHPGRLCKDECSYCFGKFGLFDTPCHIAQMKSVERQDKILAAEKHLTRDSCLCDACYRHVDRKVNTPSYNNRSSFKRNNLVGPGPKQNHCHVLGCSKEASNILKRKWIIKMKKSICDKINIDLANHGLHSIPICDEHYSMLEHLTVCAMCNRRLASNHMHSLGPEWQALNESLNELGVPVTLTDKPVVCKFCRYFATLLLKDSSERPENTTNFFNGYRKRLLHFHNIELMDEAEAEEPIPVPTKEKPAEKEHPPKRKRKSKNHSDGDQPPILEPQVEFDKSDKSKSRSESPSDYMIDYNTLIPSIALECGSDGEVPKKSSERSKQKVLLKKVPKPESIREAVEMSKNMKRIKTKSSDLAVQRLGSNPALSVRQLFPGEEEMPLHAHIDFTNIKERTPEGWEKCVTTFQYDQETKALWQELQKPYGNQSSFLRHLILLEKYFREGDLVLSSNASASSANFNESVRNRLKAFDVIPPNPAVSLSVAQKKSCSGIVTSKEIPQNFILNAANIPKNTPITISQLNSATFATNGTSKASTKTPPGLISLQPGTNKPVVTPLKRIQQSQRIKFPITKNWRPNLIPIDPDTKPEKKPGLVQVISSGKPYYISIEDYKRMYAIKRSLEMRQKKIQDAQKSFPGTSVLKGIGLKKFAKASSSPGETSPLAPTEQPEVEESSLEKLEKLDSKFNSGDRALLLPKIPKSLTVIPQTVAKRPSRSLSPVLMITQKPKVASKS